ncbi:MAG: sulfite exporter TauE/SafE family protein, partial [Planctomycetota bacterium]
GGRLITYTTLGVIAGTLGSAIDLGGSMVGLNRAAAVLTGVTLILFGIGALMRSAGKRIPAPAVPSVMQRALERGYRFAAGLPAPARAMTTGLLTTLLPCGWLYAYVIVAAGTASPIFGAAAMAAFWIGTLPVMLSLGVGARTILGKFGEKLPIIGAFAMILVGTVALFSRLDLIEQTPEMFDRIEASTSVMPDPNQQPACCDLAK